ncbi:unnamed protein product [Schistocephalus solidus]|uniref:Uncharacterized protein n=1 Tax=Schistocephalus solidus TaxID=70667 RepID=A0A183TKF2_SCHSO|nr:unnamed protein product [Schistocephalus solidus]
MVQSTDLNALGRARIHEDCFDENDAAIMLADKNRLHKAYVDRATDANNAGFYQSRRVVQQRLWDMQPPGWPARPRGSKVMARLLSADGTTLLTKKTQIRKRWAENFRNVLHQPSTISDATIDRLPQVKANANHDPLPSIQETLRAIQQLFSGKAPGSDAIRTAFVSMMALN